MMRMGSSPSWQSSSRSRDTAAAAAGSSSLLSGDGGDYSMLQQCTPAMRMCICIVCRCHRHCRRRVGLRLSPGRLSPFCQRLKRKGQANSIAEHSLRSHTAQVSGQQSTPRRSEPGMMLADGHLHHTEDMNGPSSQPVTASNSSSTRNGSGGINSNSEALSRASIRAMGPLAGWVQCGPD